MVDKCRPYIYIFFLVTMHAREGFGELGGNLLFFVIWSCKGLGEENSTDIMVEEFIIKGLKVTF